MGRGRARRRHRLNGRHGRVALKTGLYVTFLGLSVTLHDKMGNHSSDGYDDKKNDDGATDLGSGEWFLVWGGHHVLSVFL